MVQMVVTNGGANGGMANGADGNIWRRASSSR